MTERIGSATVIPAKRPGTGSPFAAPETGPGRWVVTIVNWHPTSDNKLVGKHWRTVAKLKRDDFYVIACEMIINSVPKATGRRRVSVRFVQSKGRPLDASNTNKSFRDALTKCGALIDDSAKWAEFVEPTVERGSKATIVTIEDIGERT